MEQGRTKRRMAVAVVLGAVGGWGCGAAVGGVGTGGWASGLPADLREVAEGADEAYRLAWAGEVGGLPEVVGRVEESWRRYRTERADRDGVSAEAVRGVGEAVTRLHWSLLERDGDGGPVARAANAIRGRLPGLLAAYGPRVPAGLLRAEFAARELALDGRMREGRGAEANLALLRAGWAEVRGRVVEVSGAGRAESVDRHLQALEAALAAADFAALTAVGERTVRLLERVASEWGG